MFIRNEDFGTFIRSYKVVTLLVLLNTLMWLYTSFIPSGSFLESRMIGANYWVAQGEYWRLVTPVFLHGSFGHLLFNSFSLILFAPALEHFLGKFKFLITYLSAGVIANIFTYILEGPQYIHVGASGAIFGLFGVYVYMVIYRKDLIDRVNAQLVITILIISLLMTFTRSNINVVAHIFGLIGGLALAPIILRK
jgi:rhomboid protease GluP